MGQEVTREREQVRASVAMTVRYSEPADSRQLEGVCQNLSSSGMFLGTPRAVPVGALLRIECELSDGSGRIRGAARVVWVRGEAAGEGRPAGMGLRFLNLESGSDLLIQSLLARGDLGTSGRRARSDPPGDRGDSQRPRLVAVAAIREVGSGEAGRDKHSSNPPPGGKSGAGQLRERWKNTRRQIKSDPPAGLDQASLSEQPRSTQPEVPIEGSRRDMSRTTEPDVSGPEVEARSTEPSGSPGPSHDALPEDESSEPEQLDNADWRAKRLAELVEAEAKAHQRSRGPDAAGSSSHAEVEEGVLIRGPGGSPLPGALLMRVAVGLLVVAGVLTLVLGRRGQPVTAGPEAAAPHIVPAPAPAPAPAFATPGAPGGPQAPPLPRGIDVPEELSAGDEQVSEATSADSPRERTGRSSGSSRRAAVRAAAIAEPMPTPVSTPGADDAPAEATPLETALACLKVGNSACAVKALEGQARSAREWQLLVESHRALGNVGAAEGHMREYLERFPTGSMGETYRRLLAYRRTRGSDQASTSAVRVPESAASSPAEKGPRAAPPPADPAPALPSAP
jgi:uncharacterized protein (TIGR02266 family)